MEVRADGHEIHKRFIVLGENTRIEKPSKESE